jgi:hypothetical protein
MQRYQVDSKRNRDRQRENERIRGAGFMKDRDPGGSPAEVDRRFGTAIAELERFFALIVTDGPVHTAP